MHPHRLFHEHAAAIERAIARVCHDARMPRADAEDFASSVRIELLARDCEILRRHEGRSSMVTYLTIVVRRLLVDRLRAEGRWYASAEAQRRGEAAVLLELLLHREQRTLGDAIAAVLQRHPETTRAELEAIAAALPQRAPRARVVELADDAGERYAGNAVADDRVEELDRRRRSDRTSAAMRQAMDALTAEDRVVLRLRFARGKSIADIARLLGIEQRPLYRRIERLLGELRAALERQGLGARDVVDLIGGSSELLDFGEGFGKNEATQPSRFDERDSSGGGAV